MARRYTTRAEDAAFLDRIMTDATRDWKVGDACQTMRGRHTTRVVRFNGDSVVLADGTSGHRSRMRRPIDGEREGSLCVDCGGFVSIGRNCCPPLAGSLGMVRS